MNRCSLTAMVLLSTGHLMLLCFVRTKHSHDVRMTLDVQESHRITAKGTVPASHFGRAALIGKGHLSGHLKCAQLITSQTWQSARYLLHALAEQAPLGLMVLLLLQEAAPQLQNTLPLLHAHLQTVLHNRLSSVTKSFVSKRAPKKSVCR